MSKSKRPSKTAFKKFESPFKDYWTKQNFIFLGIGLLLIIAGYYLMSISPWDNPTALNFSPIVLLIAYAVVIPISILYKKKK
ncbi:hypothetical protein MROS_1788 [Melioribacter roseus P3M-2]|uniref:DUF3098 domain-containing protein n=1 Tax=Melioribacter roseus (strain DSM 23840 / JCM 17771 / VKM B-2668 / P3M-2) TaxID=1191523 RepID=I6YWS5_MELRP|nr:hypothetical protein [Melioribacter roseus]AFN75022.1 hypothetical protein MROS_1788 [Melioribacter roseus P3M-2]